MGLFESYYLVKRFTKDTNLKILHTQFVSLETVKDLINQFFL